MPTSIQIEEHFDRLRRFQGEYKTPVSDIARQAPAKALHSLRAAAAEAPWVYRSYLKEAIDCYEASAYRGSVLMVWAASIEHLYSVIEATTNGFGKFEQCNKDRFGAASSYRRVRKKNDLLYLTDSNFLLLCEDAGVINRNGRALLESRLRTRNLCGHPTGYVLGREEAVVFIESLINNVLIGAMVQWPGDQ